MLKTYVLLDNKQCGPYSENELQDLLAARKISAETLCWREGMSEWQALGLIETATKKLQKEPVTIAPPRRTQQSGESPAFVPVMHGKKNGESPLLSARFKPMTVIRGVGIIILFFLVLTIVLKLTELSLSDTSKQFKRQVDAAIAHNKP